VLKALKMTKYCRSLMSRPCGEGRLHPLTPLPLIGSKAKVLIKQMVLVTSVVIWGAMFDLNMMPVRD
jgi:hypothetical protein